jgi:hypothetical protein
MFSQLTTFGEDDNGELYAGTLSDDLYRVVPDGFLPVYLTHFEAIPHETTVDLHWRAENAADITLFTLERSTDGLYFRAIGTVDPDAEKSNYTFTDLSPEPAINYYRLVYTLFDGSAQISDVRTVDRRHVEVSAEVYTHAGGGLSVVLHGSLGEANVSLFAMDGRLLGSHRINGAHNLIAGTEAWLPGVYAVVVESEVRVWTRKWLKH